MQTRILKAKGGWLTAGSPALNHRRSHQQLNRTGLPADNYILVFPLHDTYQQKFPYHFVWEKKRTNQRLLDFSNHFKKRAYSLPSHSLPAKSLSPGYCHPTWIFPGTKSSPLCTLTHSEALLSRVYFQKEPQQILRPAHRLPLTQK